MARSLTDVREQAPRAQVDAGVEPAMRLQPSMRWTRMGRVLAYVSSGWLLACTAIFLYASRSWPLVNDAALMHYVVFLMGRGMAPYREIGDINLPGAYLPEWLSFMLATWLHVSPAAMWRAMDAALLLLAGLAMVRIAKRYSGYAGIWAGCLFALYHGRDGVGQAGQRDLWIAMLLLWAVAFLSALIDHGHVTIAPRLLFGFAFFVGAASTIKPASVLFLLCALPFLLRQRIRRMAHVAAGFMLPLLAVLVFVVHWHALPAFLHVLTVDLPYHASLADGAWWRLLFASAIPSVWKLIALLVMLWVVSGCLRLTRRERLLAGFSRGWLVLRLLRAEGTAWADAPERGLLVFCVLLGMLSFVLQGKGYPYHRYPYLAFLFPLLALEFTAAVRSRPLPLRTAGAIGLVFGVALCAPTYLRGALQAQWAGANTEAIEHELATQAGSANLGSLNGEVQCIDIASGCTDALLHLGLREATGTIYDEFLFPQTPSAWGHVYRGPEPPQALPDAVAAGQQQFRAALLQHAPRVMVVSAWLFPEGPGDYRKLALWPWFNNFLAERYTLVAERHFPRTENGPAGFRLYVLRVPAG